MATNRIPGAKAIKFKGVDLTRWVVGWQDSRVPRLAEHEYHHTDGAEQEAMGRRAHRAMVRLNILGSDWIKTWKSIQAEIDADPIGDLDHPIYGRMRAACSGHNDGRCDVANSPNLYEVTLGFTESNLNQNVERTDGASAQLSPQNDYTKLLSALSLVSSLIAKIVVIATNATSHIINRAQEVITAARNLQANGSAFGVTALSFGTSTYDAISSATPADQATSNYGKVIAQAAAVRASLVVLQTTEEVITSADVYEVTVPMEAAVDACSRLREAAAAFRVTLVRFVVPMTMPLAVILAQFYGKDAIAREDEALTNNPGRLPIPGAVAEGTELLMAPPTTALQV